MSKQISDDTMQMIDEWDRQTTGESLDGETTIPVYWLSKYIVSLKWVANQTLTIVERIGRQRSFTMRVRCLEMLSETKYAVSGTTDDGFDVDVVFDTLYASHCNGAAYVVVWPSAG